MSWLSWLVGKDKDGLVKQAFDGVGQFIHTGQEKAAEQAEFEREVTKRWVADSAAPITRLVRPVSYFFVTACMFVFGALDASLEGFDIRDEYISLYKEAWIVMTIALFGGRSWEKIKAGKNG